MGVKLAGRLEALATTTVGVPLSLAVGVSTALAVGVKQAGRLEALATATGGVLLSLAVGVSAASA